MLWKLDLEKSNETNRLYRQERTGTETETQLIYVDDLQREWWGFKDLFKIPYLRMAYSAQVRDYFTAGVTASDLDKWDEQELQLIRSNDAEKYEKLYAIILERRKARQAVSDPQKLHLALATIYVLTPDERIDYFDMATAEKKMQAMAMDAGCMAFFLNWLVGHMVHFTENLKNISQTVLKN